MSVAFERERYLREVRFSVASMFVLVVVYGVIVTWVWAPRAVTHPDPAKLLTMEGFLAALAAAVG